MNPKTQILSPKRPLLFLGNGGQLLAGGVLGTGQLGLAGLQAALRVRGRKFWPPMPVPCPRAPALSGC